MKFLLLILVLQAAASGVVPLSNSTSLEENDVLFAQRYLGTFYGLLMETTPMLKWESLATSWWAKSRKCGISSWGLMWPGSWMPLLWQWGPHQGVGGPVFTSLAQWWGNQYGQNIMPPTESRITLHGVEGCWLCHPQASQVRSDVTPCNSNRRTLKRLILSYISHKELIETLILLMAEMETSPVLMGLELVLGEACTLIGLKSGFKHTKSINLFLVAGHEFGHSKHPKATMFLLYIMLTSTDFASLLRSFVTFGLSMRTHKGSVTALDHGTSHLWLQCDCWYYHYNWKTKFFL